MKPMILSSILLAAVSGAYAAEESSRAAIENVIATVNRSVFSAGLFTSDFTDFSQFSRLGIRNAGMFAPVFRLSRGPDELQSSSAVLVISHEPWGEAIVYPAPVSAVFLDGIATYRMAWARQTTPEPPARFAIRSIRFVTPDVALADATAERRYAIDPAGQIPVLFVMKKEGADWRIASLKVLSER